VQVEPSAMQLPLKQQPLEHVFPAQQVSPGPPQAAQRPDDDDVLVQTVPATQRSVLLRPLQQGSPGSPQEAQVLPRQVSPEPQDVPQHGCPEPPQLAHLPAEQRPPPLPPVPVELPQVCDSATHISL
jgi:hypothetical protein